MTKVIQVINNQPIIVMTSCPNLELAKDIAKILVEKKLVACAQLTRNVESIYEWQGQIESSTEVVLSLKTFRLHWETIQTQIIKIHPYEIPEIIAVDMVSISEKYEAWMREVVNMTSDKEC